MQTPRCRSRIALTASAMISAATCSGCGFDGVELNGAVFDYIGISTAAQSKEREPKLEPRTGLVLPPDLERLPQPGEAQAAAPPEAWPDDPDQRKAAAAANLDRQHAEFCREALWKARAQHGENNMPQIKGPKGMCNPSILKALTGKDVTTRQ
jgi:hypothetical protein